MLIARHAALPFRHIAIAFGCLAWSAIFSANANAADWIFAPAPYTHNPQNGERVAQYCPTPKVYVYTQPNFTRGVYEYQRSSLQVGDSIDNLHIVNQAGPPVIPYRQWQFPFRPYGAPYDAWGPQNFGISTFNGGGNFGGFGGGWGGPGPGGPAGFGPGFGPGFGGGFGNGAVDGYGGNVNPYAPGGGPWGGTYSLPRSPLDPRSGVFGPSEQQEWFDRRSHGPQIRPFTDPVSPYYLPQFFPQPAPPAPPVKDALGSGSSGST